MLNKKVSILLATYNPRTDWFGLLLDSLNNQDYPNYDLVILDDCSPDVSLSDIEEIVKKHITKVEYKIHQNISNVGSNKTFEKLLSLTDSHYIAFCDQDDIWHENKLSKDIELLSIHHKKMVCSDVRVIDGEGKLLSNSITTFKKRFDLHPEEQFRYLLSKNFVIGCTVVMDRELALEATPFFNTMVHDHILAVYASSKNELIVNDDAMIDYRIHGSNQTSTLNNIKTRNDYKEKYVKKYYETVMHLSTKIDNQLLKEALEWAIARMRNARKEKGSFKALKSKKAFNKKTTLFELYALRCWPLFKLGLFLLKHNVM